MPEAEEVKNEVKKVPLKGVVKRWEEKGFGFITVGALDSSRAEQSEVVESEDVYVHRSSLVVSPPPA